MIVTWILAKNYVCFNYGVSVGLFVMQVQTSRENCPLYIFELLTIFSSSIFSTFSPHPNPPCILYNWGHFVLELTLLPVSFLLFRYAVWFLTLIGKGYAAEAAMDSCAYGKPPSISSFSFILRWKRCLLFVFMRLPVGSHYRFLVYT